MNKLDYNESNWEVFHQPCNTCGSSDGVSINGDGSWHCFVCQAHGSKYDGEITEGSMQPRTSKVNRIKTEGIVGDLPDRKISSATTKKYGVTRVNSKDGKISKHLYPYYDEDGNQVAQKIRDVENKDFYIEGTVKDAVLFGANVVSPSGKFVTITEGECDAMAVYELLGSKWSVVSLINGASSATKDIKRNLSFFDEFETVVICFDMDKAGKEAAKKVADLFPPSKAKIVALPDGYKDANDMLRDNKKKAFMDAWWDAKLYAPDGIVRGIDMWKVVTEEIQQSFIDYPWKGLNELTYGIRTHEMVTLTAGSGMGKSQVLRELVHYLLKSTDESIGLLFLEESIKRTGLSLMSVEANKLLHLPDTAIDEVEFQESYDATLGTGRIFMFDSFGSNTIDRIISRIRHMAKGFDCKYIFLDHISILVSSQENGDERKALDEISTKLRTLVQETGICLFMVSHLKRPGGTSHEEGGMTSLSQLRGSAGIGQLSDMVIGLERNGQHEDEFIRNTTTIRVLKNRFAGLTGPACYLHYDKDTGRMSETDNPYDKEDDDNDF